MAGVSDNENKQTVREWIMKLDPQDVLDIGAGVGTYSILAKMPYQNWTALEVFAPYVKMFNLEGKYNKVVVADARYANYDKLGFFDLIIAADMLEHMPKADAKELINELLHHAKRLLICVPVIHNHQEAGQEGNDFEAHIDHWTADEMRLYLSAWTVEQEAVGDVSAYFMVVI